MAALARLAARGRLASQVRPTIDGGPSPLRAPLEEAREDLDQLWAITHIND